MSARTYPPGTLVMKGPAAIVNNTTANLYTVNGGAVLVDGLAGLVTTTLSSTANLSIGTTGAAASIATATALANNAAGTWVVPVTSGGKATSLVIAGAVFTLAPPFIINPFIVGAGNITWTTSAAATGQMQWYLWYTPIDEGATVS